MKTLISVLFFMQFSSKIFARNKDNSTVDGKFKLNARSQSSIYAEVTYPGIGQFTTKDFYDPIYRPIVFLPKSPERIRTKFLLHTRRNINTTQVLTVGNLTSIKSSYFKAKNAIKFIVPGYLDNQFFGQWMRNMKDAFLMADDCNVIIVDWSGGNKPPYTQATANSRVVGPVISLLINDLKTVFGIDLSNVHILGHSLGSHIAGYAGEKLNGKIGRITGLDPAGPYFEGVVNPAAKLDPTDAQFVDVIHTDAEGLIPKLGLGMYETSGHLDFYPNGGKNHPGCNQEKWSAFITGLREGARRLVACNIQRAVDFYLASLNQSTYKGVGYQCQDYVTFESGDCVDCGSGDKCAFFGDDAIQSRKFKNSTQGLRFFLKTTDKYPYFKYEYEIKIKLSEPSKDRLSAQGILMLTLHGNSSEANVTLNKDEMFDLGQTYSFIQNIGYSLGDIKRITFRWNTGLSLSKITQKALGSLTHRHMWIDSITVVPLSSSNVLNRKRHLTEIKTFCTTIRNEGLLNENDYQFSENCE